MRRFGLEASECFNKKIQVVEDDASISSVGQVDGSSDEDSHVNGDHLDSQSLNFNTSIVDEGDSIDDKISTIMKMRASWC